MATYQVTCKGTPEAIETRITDEHGRPVWMNVRNDPDYPNDGNLAGAAAVALCTWLDLTADDLGHVERELRVVARTSTDVTYALDL